MSVITPFDQSIFNSAPPAIRAAMNEERRLAGLPPFTMKTELRPKPHSVLPGQTIYEIWYDNTLIGTVCGADGPGVRIISKHPVTVAEDVSPSPLCQATEVRIDKEKLL